MAKFIKEKSLNELLEKVLDQATNPQEVVIVDGGHLSPGFISAQEFNLKRKDIEFLYHKKTTQ